MSLRKTLLTSLFVSLALALIACGGGSHTPPAGNAPTIAAQPSSLSVTVGQTATFTVTASGTAPLSYQWVKGTNWIAGATAASYITPVTTMQDDGTVGHDNPVWVTFARAMAPMMMVPAQLLAALVDPQADRKLKILDIAAGHGLYGLAFAKKNPQADLA